MIKGKGRRKGRREGNSYESPIEGFANQRNRNIDARAALTSAQPPAYAASSFMNKLAYQSWHQLRKRVPFIHLTIQSHSGGTGRKLPPHSPCLLMHCTRCFPRSPQVADDVANEDVTEFVKLQGLRLGSVLVTFAVLLCP